MFLNVKNKQFQIKSEMWNVEWNHLSAEAVFTAVTFEADYYKHSQNACVSSSS